MVSFSHITSFDDLEDPVVSLRIILWPTVIWMSSHSAVNLPAEWELTEIDRVIASKIILDIAEDMQHTADVQRLNSMALNGKAKLILLTGYGVQT